MDHRKVVDGVMFRTRSGCAWRDLPAGYGHWKTVYNRHRRWSGDGTWRMVLSELRVDCDLLDAGEWAVGVDGTVIRAHHHSAGARHRPPKDIPAEVLAPTVLEVDIKPVKSTGGSIECHEFRGAVGGGAGSGGPGSLPGWADHENPSGRGLPLPPDRSGDDGRAAA